MPLHIDNFPPVERESHKTKRYLGEKKMKFCGALIRSPPVAEMEETDFDSGCKDTHPDQRNRNKVTVSISLISRPPRIKRIGL